MTVPKSMCSFSFKHHKTNRIADITEAIFKNLAYQDKITDVWRDWAKNKPMSWEIGSFYEKLNMMDGCERRTHRRIQGEEQSLGDIQCTYLLYHSYNG